MDIIRKKTVKENINHSYVYILECIVYEFSLNWRISIAIVALVVD